MDMRKLIARNFKRIRDQKGLTQEQIEERSGFSQQYLSDLENGKNNPTIITLYELAQTLEVSHLDLLWPDEQAYNEGAAFPPRLPMA